MYTSIKKLYIVCAILTAVNILMTILLLFGIPTLDMSFALAFTVGTLLVSISLVFLFLTIALRNLYDTLEFDYENMSGKLRELDKRLRKIEENM